MCTPLTVIYVAYGNDDVYHSGVVFNWLRLMGLGYTQAIDNVIVYTDQPERYVGFPGTIRAISLEEMADWTLNGDYHFRVKTKVLAEAVSTYKGKVLHIDSDILIEQPLTELFDLITSEQCIFANNEGPICSLYHDLINTNHNDFENFYADLNKDIRMYCSALVGVSFEMLPAIIHADQLMLQWLPQTQAHTIEQFSISEALLRSGIRIKSVFNCYDDFGTKGKKAHAKHRIRQFFDETKKLHFDEQAKIAAKWKVRRSFTAWLKQKLKIIS